MSSPSDLHEQRVRLLEDLSDLIGHTIEVAVCGSLRPDLCRLHHRASSIFIADAKASETPNDLATRRWLARYAVASRLWTMAGFQVAFGVCHDLDPKGRWRRTLTSCMATAGQSVKRITYSALDGGAAVSIITVDLSSSLARRRAVPCANCDRTQTDQVHRKERRD